MQQYRQFLFSLAVASLGSSFAMAAGLPNNTAFVDPKGGTDSGTCGAVTSQCATLNQALANVTTNGVVYVQSGASFGPIYLTTQVSITGPEDGSLNIVWNPGAPGCVGAAPGSCGLSTANYAVEVAAGASDAIKFKNVLINNGAGSSGAVKLGNAANVKLTRVVLRGGTGTIPQLMLVAPNTGSQFHLLIKEGDIAYSNSGGGVLVQPQASTSVVADIAGTLVHNLKFGLKFDTSATMAAAGVSASINKAEVGNFSGSGIAVIGAGNSLSRVAITRSNLFNSGGFAVQVNGASASVNLYEDTIVDNAIGVNVQAGGTASSLGNNDFGNGTDCTIASAPTSCSSVLIPQSPL